MKTPLEAANWYLDKGIIPLPVPYRTKAPQLPEWSQFRPDSTALAQHFNGTHQNIGALMGEPSGWLVSADLDWPECESLAQQLLPQSWSFGRLLNHQFSVRHILFRSPGAKSMKLQAPPAIAGDSRCIIELLSTGKQVIMPASVHEQGSVIEWKNRPGAVALAEISSDELTRLLKLIAGAALLVRLWPELEGSRHEVTLALAGACHHAGWSQDNTIKVLVAMLTAAHDTEKRDRGLAIKSTLDKAAAGEAVTGLNRLADYLPSEVTDCLVKWWDLGAKMPALTFGGSTAVQSQWPMLLEFEDIAAEGPATPYPVDALGPVMAEAVTDLVAAQQVPEALAAQSVLAAASTVTHMRYNVLADNRHIPLSLWLVLVAEPGERKTTTDERAFEVIYERMEEAAQVYEVQLSAWKQARMDKEMGDPGPAPRQPNWLVTDTTTEGIMRSLHKHWPALTLTNSDAAAWLGGYSMREGRDSATAASLSQLWSGQFQSILRVSMDGAATMYGRRLVLSLMMQPEMAGQLFSSPTLSGQGFLSRCLPAFPHSTIGTRSYRRSGDLDGLTAFHVALDKLLVIPVNMNPVSGDLTLIDLSLTDSALDAWIPIYNRFETGLLGEYAAVRETANKAAEQVLRLAGVQAAVEGSETVEVPHIENAARLVDYYMEQWVEISVRLRAYRKEIALPRMLLEWMQERRRSKEQTIFSLRDTYKNGPRIVRNQSDLAHRLYNELLRRGYVRMIGNDYELRPAEVE